MKINYDAENDVLRWCLDDADNWDDTLAIQIGGITLIWSDAKNRLVGIVFESGAEAALLQLREAGF